MGSCQTNLLSLLEILDVYHKDLLALLDCYDSLSLNTFTIKSAAESTVLCVLGWPCGKQVIQTHHGKVGTQEENHFFVSLIINQVSWIRYNEIVYGCNKVTNVFSSVCLRDKTCIKDEYLCSLQFQWGWGCLFCFILPCFVLLFLDCPFHLNFGSRIRVIILFDLFYCEAL